MWWKWFSSVEDDHEWLVNDAKLEVSPIMEKQQILLSVAVIWGSVPCFWRQSGLSAELNFSGTIEID